MGIRAPRETLVIAREVKLVRRRQRSAAAEAGAAKVFTDLIAKVALLLRPNSLR